MVIRSAQIIDTNFPSFIFCMWQAQKNVHYYIYNIAIMYYYIIKKEENMYIQTKTW